MGRELNRCSSLSRQYSACVLVACLAGCVVIPSPNVPIRDIPPQQRALLVVGETTRLEILMRYGEPEVRLDADRVIAYRWDRERAVVAFIMGGGFQVTDEEALLLEFDNGGKLARLGMASGWDRKAIEAQAIEWSRTATPPKP